MTVSSASSVQDSLQKSLSVDSIPELEIQDYSSVQEQDASPAGPVFQDFSSPQKDLAKLEQRKKTEPGTWDKLKDGTEYARGYVEGLVSLNDLRNQVAADLGIKNPLAESPYYLAGHESGKEDIKEGLTYVSGFTDGINPMTPIGDALAESLDIERQHAGKESTYWKGRSDGAAVGVMVDGAMMASGGEMMMGSAACEVGSGGVCTIAAAPAFVTGLVISAGGTVSMASHAGMYAEAQQQYMQSRARENISSSRKTSKASEPRKINPSKAESPVWKDLKPFREDIKTNGLSGKKIEYYQWDHTHHEIEVYGANRMHKGVKDPLTGEMIKDAVPGRRIKF